MKDNYGSEKEVPSLEEVIKRIKRLEEDMDEVRQLLPRYWELHNSILDLTRKRSD
jgi:hypothetical protein